MTGRDVTTIERMQCGGLAGLVAQTITYPLEVTRRRMQTIGIVATSGSDAALAAIKGSSASDAVRSALSDRPPSLTAIVADLYKEQGIRGFFKGVSMNWVKGPVAFSISFTTFDLIQGFIETESEREFRLPRRRTTRVVVPEKKES
jgi:solute carrier family 25, member 42